MSLPRLVGRASLVVALMASTAAGADTRIGADLALNGGYTTNPYGSTAGESGSGTVSATFAPTATINSPTGSTSFGGTVTHTEYSRLYAGTTDYSVSARTGQQISPLTTMSAGVSYSNYVRNGLFPVIDPIVGGPENPGDPIIVDPSASSNFRERTETVSGQFGLGFTLSPLDSLNASVHGARVMFPEESIYSQEYDSYGGSLNYMRAIGPYSSIGAGVSVSRSDYRDPAYGDTTQYSPTALFSTRIAPRVSLDLSAGLTFSETKLPMGTLQKTSFSGSAKLCRDGDRVRFCFSGSHGVSPTSIGGSSRVTALGASYHYAINERSNFSASASYSRSQSLQGLNGSSSDYARIGLGYDRQILRRLSATVSASYNDSYDSAVTREPNFYGTVGLRYRLGNR